MFRPVAALLPLALSVVGLAPALAAGEAERDLVILRFPAAGQPAAAAEDGPPMRVFLLEPAAADRPRTKRGPPLAAGPRSTETAAGEPAPAPEAERPFFDAEGVAVSLSSGLRDEDLRWNIAADRSGRAEPNVLSELTWSSVRILALDGRMEIPVWRGLGVALRGGIGVPLDGRNRDSDWSQNNRRSEFSRSYGDVKGDGAIDLGVEAGWRLGSAARNLTPLIGYGWQSLDLDIRNGVRTIRPVLNADGTLGGIPVNEKISGLDSRYEQTWSGPYLGLAGRTAVADRWTLAGRLERHWSRYRAEAKWNLRTDFAQPVSFRHSGDGEGWRGEVELAWRRPDGLELTLGANARRFRLDNGLDETYFSDGGSARTRLNEVRWDSVGVNVGLRYEW